MKLIVSIHDVTPANRAAVLELWAMCRAQGVTPALFVVPNWHGEWPLSAHQDFVSWLKGCSAMGAEIFLHGERHDEQGSTRSLHDHFRAFGVTDTEGEFLSLSHEEMRTRIVRGLEALRACGLEPSGFVPPAWLGPKDWHQVVTSMGFSMSEDVSSIHLHGIATHVPTPVIRWSTRTPLRALLSVLVAEVRWRKAPQTPLMRIALHPDDLTSPRVRASIVRTLGRWLEQHHPWNYATL